MQNKLETPVIELRHVEKYFGNLHVLKDINLKVNKGETVAVIGPSGSGKSTLCRTINRLETISSGEILIEGQKLPEEGKPLAKLRAEVGMVFQQFNLFSHMTILQNVMIGPVDILKQDKKSAKANALELLKKVGVESQAGKYPAELSGGQRQRVAIARALAMEPELLVADEPIASLDVSIQAQIVNLFRHLQREHGFSFLFIAHDLAMVEFLSDRVGVMYHGKLVELAPTQNLFNNPLHPYTKALLSAIPIPDPRLERARTLPNFDDASFPINGTFKEVEPEHFVLTGDTE